jgi:hypothetical protein
VSFCDLHFVIFMVTTMMPHGALAGDYEAASAAAKNGDFSRAVVLLK